MAETIHIQTEFIKLDSLLKLASIGGSGGQAKQIIHDGVVSVNGHKCTQRGKKINPGDKILIDLDPTIELTIIQD